MSSIEKVANVSFKKFLGDYKNFLIPAFQRPYSWQPKNIAAFWESVISSRSHYYIGTIVAIGSSKDGVNLEIIDGQQRITTLMLFFVALRDFLKSHPKDFDQADKKVAGAEKYLWSFDDFSDNKEIRLHFNKNNLIDIYEALVEGDKDSVKNNREDLDDNQLRFVKNYDFLKKQIKEHFKSFEKPKEKIAAFDDLVNKFTELEFILIVCKSDSDAFQLFEGLNSTGLDLSVVDVLKNAVLKAVSGKTKGNRELLLTAEEIWNQMEGEFEEKNIKLFQRFVRHQWIAKNGYISSSKLFESIKEKKLNLASSSKDVIKYAKELRDDAQVYLDIRFADKRALLSKKLKRAKESKKILEYLDYFSKLNVEQVYAVLLALFSKFNDSDEYTPKQFLNDIRRLWNFAFRTRFISISPASYESIFADLCKEVTSYTGKNVDRKTKPYFEKLNSLAHSSEAEFVENFAADFRYVPDRDNTLIRYVLQQIYMKSNPTITINDVTTDHFVPQEPSKWGLSKEEVSKYVHNIGNLTLLNDKVNKSLQNISLKEKVEKVYARDHFEENRALVKLQSLFKTDPEEAIKQRGIDLAKKAYHIFDVLN
jgi:uncharacterized protein with ParB-like and HNH nuclease domain